jgi:hypothetical protein
MEFSFLRFCAKIEINLKKMRKYEFERICVAHCKSKVAIAKIVKN